jgi:autotransporter passenger strand-loop-strand repeat protein
MTTTTISAGVTSGGFTVTSGNTLIVLSGGTASNVTVASGGVEIISGGLSFSGTISGGTETVSAGSSHDETVVAGGTQNIQAGAVAIATSVEYDGIQNAYGGTTSLTVITGDGAEGGTSGAVMISTTVTSDAILNVLSGATASSTQIQDGGNQYVSAGGTDISPLITGLTLSTGGNDWISGGATVVNPRDGSDGTLSLLNGAVVSGAIIFTSGTGNDLDIYATTPGGVPTATISGYAPTMTIDLIDLPYTSGHYPDVIPLNGSDQLIVPSVSGTVTLQLAGNYAGYTFSGTNDGAAFVQGYDGDQIIVTPCFAAGTSIATSRGEIPVEDLNVGDEVISLHAGAAPIIWMGHRKVNCRHHPKPEQVWPVRVAAGAFGPDLPTRDLWLSPDHAVYENNSLIPVRELINGQTIEQVAIDEITYYHIELRHHDIVLAEGLPVETYLDTGNRENFAGRQGDIALHPNFAALVWDASACAPLVLSGPALKKARRRLSLIAKNRPKDAPARRRA